MRESALRPWPTWMALGDRTITQHDNRFCYVYSAHVFCTCDGFAGAGRKLYVVHIHWQVYFRLESEAETFLCCHNLGIIESLPFGL